MVYLFDILVRDFCTFVYPSCQCYFCSIAWNKIINGYSVCEVE
uniref:Uncharacterized protein n=1 Tax=Rhizophora mucronata TaxID=61149 RepID=A0A2P2MY62_RHIMU